MTIKIALEIDVCELHDAIATVLESGAVSAELVQRGSGASTVRVVTKGEDENDARNKMYKVIDELYRISEYPRANEIMEFYLTKAEVVES